MAGAIFYIYHLHYIYLKNPSQSFSENRIGDILILGKKRLQKLCQTVGNEKEFWDESV